MVTATFPWFRRTEDQAWLDTTEREAREAISRLHVEGYARVRRAWEEATRALDQQWDYWCQTLRSSRWHRAHVDASGG